MAGNPGGACQEEAPPTLALTLNGSGIEARPSALRLSPFLMAYGFANGMELKIDKAGRIVVPKPLREPLRFKPDTELEAIEQPEGVLLGRVEQRPSSRAYIRLKRCESSSLACA
jgi:AbrB family looped-hinge helix DNA binding protein